MTLIRIGVIGSGVPHSDPYLPDLPDGVQDYRDFATSDYVTATIRVSDADAATVVASGKGTLV